jgi:2-polyprenyl-3-methyl-5-hydroxy-6-metoxy-1,4-benzoquinol methylase
MDIAKASTGLHLTASGVWQARNKADISYPDYGNETSFQLEEQSFWFRHRNRCLVAIIKLFEFKGTLIDVGGGNGYVTSALCQNEIDAILLEPGPEGVRNAQSRGLSPIICSSFQEAGFRDGSLDAVGSFDVIEHLQNDREFILKVKDALKPDGLFFVSVPAYLWMWTAEDTEIGHFRRYTRSSIMRLLRECGFEIEYSTYFFAFLVLPVFLLRSFPYWLGLRRKFDLEKAASAHKSMGSFSTSIIDKLAGWELEKIRRRSSIPIGSSILVVARKTNG